MAQSIVNDPKSWGKKDADEALRAKLIAACIVQVHHVFADEDNWKVTKALINDGATEMCVRLKVQL